MDKVIGTLATIFYGGLLIGVIGYVIEMNCTKDTIDKVADEYWNEYWEREEQEYGCEEISYAAKETGCDDFE